MKAKDITGMIRFDNDFSFNYIAIYIDNLEIHTIVGNKLEKHFDDVIKEKNLLDLEVEYLNLDYNVDRRLRVPNKIVKLEIYLKMIKQ